MHPQNRHNKEKSCTTYKFIDPTGNSRIRKLIVEAQDPGYGAVVPQVYVINSQFCVVTKGPPFYSHDQPVIRAH